MITQPKSAEAMRDPQQPLAGGVRSLWVGIINRSRSVGHYNGLNKRAALDVHKYGLAG